MNRDCLYLTPGARRWYDRLARYLALFVVLVTVVSTTVVFLVTGNELGEVKSLVTACLGALGLVLSLQLEILFRMFERSRSREGYSRLLEAIEDYPDVFPLVVSCLDASVTTIEHAGTPQMKREVFRILDHCRVQLLELAQGRLRREGSDNGLVLDLFRNTESILQGTTDEADNEWWRSDHGRRFLKLNVDLIRRGVQVERIWLLSAPPSQDSIRLFDEHLAAGVAVFVVRIDRTDVDGRLVVNLTMMDESLVQMDVPNKEGRAVEYLYSENPVDIERAKATLAQLKSRANRYVGPESIETMHSEARGVSAPIE